MDQKNFAIGILSTTAAILLVGLVLTSRPESAAASGMTAAGGEYIMSVGRTPQTDEEFVYVVDVPGQKMIAYRFDSNKNNVDIVQAIDLAPLREAGQGQPPAQPPGRRQP